MCPDEDTVQVAHLRVEFVITLVTDDEGLMWEGYGDSFRGVYDGCVRHHLGVLDGEAEEWFNIESGQSDGGDDQRSEVVALARFVRSDARHRVAGGEDIFEVVDYECFGLLSLNDEFAGSVEFECKLRCLDAEDERLMRGRLDGIARFCEGLGEFVPFVFEEVCDSLVQHIVSTERIDEKPYEEADEGERF